MYRKPKHTQFHCFCGCSCFGKCCWWGKYTPSVWNTSSYANSGVFCFVLNSNLKFAPNDIYHWILMNFRFKELFIFYSPFKILFSGHDHVLSYFSAWYPPSTTSWTVLIPKRILLLLLTLIRLSFHLVWHTLLFLYYKRRFHWRARVLDAGWHWSGLSHAGTSHARWPNSNVAVLLSYFPTHKVSTPRKNHIPSMQL